MAQDAKATRAARLGQRGEHQLALSQGLWIFFLEAKWSFFFFFSIPCLHFTPFEQLKIIITIKMHLEAVAQY